MVSEEVRKAFEDAARMAVAREKTAILATIMLLHSALEELGTITEKLEARVSRLERRNNA